MWPTDASVLEILADIMQVVTGIAATSIAFIVFRHNRRTDKETLRERAWAAQQQLNYISLADPDVLRAAEFTINGIPDGEPSDEDLKRAIYATFIQLNRIHLLWNGYRSGIFKRSEIDDEILPTLTLISGNRALLDYCLNRGYSKPFVEFASQEADALYEKYGQPEESSKFLKKLREQMSSGTASADR